jgi:hypothetical protein
MTTLGDDGTKLMLESETESLAEEEIAFWRGFVEWWVRDREGPVPPRAWEALASAESRRGSCLDEQIQ